MSGSQSLEYVRTENGTDEAVIIITLVDPARYYQRIAVLGKVVKLFTSHERKVEGLYKDHFHRCGYDSNDTLWKQKYTHWRS